METISNIAASAATTASKLIYGEQPKTDAEAETQHNETAGKEPVSGQQGKGTVAEPFDQGNAPTPLAQESSKSAGTWLDYGNTNTEGKEPVSGQQGQGTVTEPFDQGNDAKATKLASGTNDEFLRLNPTLDGPQGESSGKDPKIYSNGNDATYAGMDIVPLNPDAATSNTGAKSSSALGTRAVGTTDKVWQETSLDDVSRAGAPGAGPSAPAHVTTTTPGTVNTASTDPAIKTAAPDSVTAASSTYQGFSTLNKEPNVHEVGANKDSKTTTDDILHTGTGSRDTPAWTSTGVASEGGLAGEKSARKSESGRRSTDIGTTASNDEKSGKKISQLKDKLKDKLHIGSKDK